MTFIERAKRYLRARWLFEKQYRVLNGIREIEIDIGIYEDPTGLKQQDLEDRKAQLVRIKREIERLQNAQQS